MSFRKILKVLLITSLMSFLAITALMVYATIKYKPTVAEVITDSVVIVENSSGIVVYQDEEYSLVLTAAHVIHNKSAQAPFTVKIFSINENGKVEIVPYEVEDYDIDDKLDLAILKIPALDETIIPARISRAGEDPKLGDEIYVASNPHMHYRSLKRGIVSSKYRINSSGVNTWEIDAMIIFGSSGGGVFTNDGRLFGIVSGIDALQSDHCWGIIDLEGKSSVQCLSLPLPEIGYIVSPRNIRSFISKSKFADYFDL